MSPLSGILSDFLLRDEAVDYARRALTLIPPDDERMRNYVKKFVRDLEVDARRAKRQKK